MKKFLLFIALLSFLSCKREGDGGGDDEQQPQAGHLTVEAAFEGETKAKGNNEIALVVRNTSPEVIKITDISKVKGPDFSITLTQDLQGFGSLQPGEFYYIDLSVTTDDKTRSISIDEPIKISYKEGQKLSFTKSQITGKINWLSDEDVDKEFKVAIVQEPKKPGSPIEEALFTIKNEGKYPVKFERDFLEFKDDTQKGNFTIDVTKTTCKPEYAHEKDFGLAPGKGCNLYLKDHLLKPKTINLGLLYKMLGKEHKLNFDYLAHQ
jgi:hypothetical protein